jgi:hypothetical protein
MANGWWLWLPLPGKQRTLVSEAVIILAEAKMRPLSTEHHYIPTTRRCHIIRQFGDLSR